MNDLIPALAATAIPALTLLAISHLMRGQSGQHSAGMVRPDAPYLNPLTARQRKAIRYYAQLDMKTDRIPFVNRVNTEATA